MGEVNEWKEATVVLRYRESVLTPGGVSRDEPETVSELVDEIDRAMNASHFGGRIQLELEAASQWKTVALAALGVNPDSTAWLDQQVLGSLEFALAYAQEHYTGTMDNARLMEDRLERAEAVVEAAVVFEREFAKHMRENWGLETNSSTSGMVSASRALDSLDVLRGALVTYDNEGGREDTLGPNGECPHCGDVVCRCDRDVGDGYAR